MNFLSRAFLSTKENIGKTALLFLVMTTICVFILSGISIQQATTQASNFAREKLGATVTLQPNMQKMREDMRQNGEDGRFQIKNVSIPMSDVDQILKLNDIVGYNLTTTTTGIADGFEPVSSSSTQESNGPEGGFPSKMQQEKGNLKIDGVLDQGLLQDAKNGTIKLVDGTGITKDNVNQDVAVISQALASNDNLKVGDTVKIQSPITNDVYSVKIQGIYETNQEINEMAVRNESMNPYNAIYVPYTLANTMKGSDYANTVDQATFYLNDPLNVDSFVKAAEKLDIDYNTYMLNADNKAYETMIGPINNVSSFAKMTVIGASIAGALILALIIILTIKNRRNEIGILLSLGEKKGKIIGQFIIEMLIVLVIALGVSAGVGGVVSNKIGNTLVQKEISVTTQNQEQNGFGGGFNGGGFRGPEAFGGNHQEVTPISSISVSVSGEDFVEMAAIALIIMIIGIGIPSIGIMRLQPKEILSRHD